MIWPRVRKIWALPKLTIYHYSGLLMLILVENTLHCHPPPPHPTPPQYTPHTPHPPHQPHHHHHPTLPPSHHPKPKPQTPWSRGKGLGKFITISAYGMTDDSLHATLWHAHFQDIVMSIKFFCTCYCWLYLSGMSGVGNCIGYCIKYKWRQISPHQHRWLNITVFLQENLLILLVPKPEYSEQTMMCPGSLSRQRISIHDIWIWSINWSFSSTKKDVIHL